VTLNRPEARNALSRQTNLELFELASELEADEDNLAAIVITGAGDQAFCAGADLKERRGVSAEDSLPYIDAIARAIEAWQRLRRPTIAAMNGSAYGGGLELALSCDLRVIVEGAELGLTEVRLGIMPGAGGTQRLPRMVPLAKAMEMILMGETCSAQEAHRIGLVNAVVPAADVLPTARRWAGIICERGPLAVRAAKEAIIRGLSLPLADGLRLEAFLSGTLRGTEDAVEGPKAFAEKRKPVFRAR